MKCKPWQISIFFKTRYTSLVFLLDLIMKINRCVNYVHEWLYIQCVHEWLYTMCTRVTIYNVYMSETDDRWRLIYFVFIFFVLELPRLIESLVGINGSVIWYTSTNSCKRQSSADTIFGSYHQNDYSSQQGDFLNQNQTLDLFPYSLQ